MKYAITLFLALVICGGVQTRVKAQQIDQERMNRDIKVSKNILGEMFKRKWAAHGTKVEVFSFSLSVGQFNNINGMYIPDYGVIFSIPGGPPAFVTKTNAKGKATSYEFENGGEQVTKRSIINRLEKFLRNYGTTIGQLKSKEHITIMYQGNNQESFSLVHFSSGNIDSKNKPDRLPSILVSVTKNDLMAYKRGKLSADEINDRMHVSIKNNKDSGHQDVKIMNNIIKTAFKDAEEKKYHVSGSQYAYVNNLGGLFYVVASYGTGFDSIESTVGNMRDKFVNLFQEDSEESQLVVVNGDTVKGYVVHPDTISGQIAHPIAGSDSNSNNSQKSKSKQEVKAYHHFLERMKETVVDYGGTLRSVKHDEQVFVSITLTGSNDKIPDRTTLRIKKSALEALDKGQISRQQAMDKISVREH